MANIIPTTSNQLASLIQTAIPVGTVFNNPGGGTSTVTKVGEDKISYRRGNSTMSIRYSDLYEAYSTFKGKKLLSSELKSLWPSIFDSAARPAGHSCHCTFLMLILVRLDLSSRIHGKGRVGSPFFVDLTSP